MKKEKEFSIGRIAQPRESSVLDVLSYKGVLYGISVHQNGYVDLKCVTDRFRLKVDEEIVEAIKVWAAHPEFAALNVQQFVSKLLPASKCVHP